MPDEKNEYPHNVFISWSGNRSRYVAEALREWLPMVLQAAKPFMSKSDIEKGTRWHVELAKALEVTKVGVICLTPENLVAPWLLFEAGALSKTIDQGTHVCTYLLAGLQSSEVVLPLGQFQATRAEKEETRRMLQDINKALGSAIAETILSRVFDALWPQLEARLSSLPEESNVPDKRKVEDMVAEILNLNRDAAKRGELIQQFDRYLPTLEILMRVMESNISTLAVPLAASGAQNAPAARIKAQTPTSWPEPVEGRGIPGE